MEPTKTGAHLQQFICALQWMEQGIPNFTNLVISFHDFMECIYGFTESRKKRSVSRILLSDHGWGQIELNAFDDCKKALVNQVTLSHCDLLQLLRIYTDAPELL